MEFVYGFLILLLLISMFVFNAPILTMELFAILFVVLIADGAHAETYYTFNYKTKDELRVSVPASDYFEARTKASKICFQALTGGKYQGEEAGLDIISICVNPLK